MTDFDFLPSLRPAVNGLALIGATLLAGLICGELFRRVLRLPRITGYVLAGLALGPGTLDLVGEELRESARILLEVALGLILFELGSRVDYQWLRRNPWLLAMSLAESALSFAFIYVVLALLDVAPLHALLAAAIGMATAPSVLLMVIHDQRADGPLTEQAVNLTALNNALAVLTFTMLLAQLHMQYQAGLHVVLLHPVYLLAGSLLLGWLSSMLVLLLARWLGKREDLQFVLLVGVILLTVGCAVMLKLSVLIALLALGVMARNRDRHRSLLPVEFGSAAQFFFVGLFVLTGAYLSPRALLEAGWVALAYVAARTTGKLLGIALFAPLTGLRPRKAGLLGLSLTPMAAVAVVLVQVTTQVYPAFGEELAAIVLSAVLLLAIVGPGAVQFALRLAGETRKA
jgi:Kef-type K+ transport system membrane component KefB